MKSDDELIAEFYYGEGRWDDFSNCYCVPFLDNHNKPRYMPMQSNFNKDWNDLMNVIVKIQKMGFTVSVNFQSISRQCDTSIFNSTMQEQIFEEESTSILATYKAVVAFIKWYNAKYKPV